MKIYWQLFTIFFKIGAFTLGGGYSMIPLIEREIVTNRKWMEPRDFIDMLALAQAAPGVIAINTAIFVGYKIKGVKGSLVTSLGAALPSFIIILLIAVVFTDIKDNEMVNRIFKGIRPAIVALIAAPVWNMAKSAGVTWKTAFIPVVAALLIWWLGVSPVIVILGAIVGGIGYGIWNAKRKQKVD
ncbi:chromate transporter [Paludibacter sp. 221]|uniref:chromate transporter n=1 Tax=Paludibacter sp. 221 TaxID=2302939 RepID=UPI0013D104C6|nr:chromate transporter [Paludibacter sp. 221]NDV47368.1 chromate transporter [Paludibacter sp. 221]